MTLKKWIEVTGRNKVADKLNVSQPTITMWLQKKVAPKDKTKILINRASNGQVKYSDMIEPFHGDL